MTAVEKSKPRLFIGSSTEGLEVAQHIQAGLEYAAESTIWSQGVFGLTQGSLESIVVATKSFDFAVLVLTPDDVVIRREASRSSPRDNVLFELGLFMGALGRERTFIVYCRDESLELPTDLAGVAAETFPRRTDGNLGAAVGPVCLRLKEAMKRVGPLPGNPPVAPDAPSSGVTSQPLDSLDATLPCDAANRVFKVVTINGTECVIVQYTVTSQVAVPSGMTRLERQFLDIYEWNGNVWTRIFNIYEWAQTLYQPDDLGLVLNGQPQVNTAALYAELSIMTCSGLWASIGDVCILNISYYLGPRNVQHPSPTIAVVARIDHEFRNVWNEQFGVRGGLISARMSGKNDRELDIIVDAYLPGDPACCPNGWEQLRLAPSGHVPSKLEVVKRCTTPRYTGCLHSM